jgi:hypothetical protein
MERMQMLSELRVEDFLLEGARPKEPDDQTYFINTFSPKMND